jgi:hypothetical protein
MVVLLKLIYSSLQGSAIVLVVRCNLIYFDL